MSSTDYQRAREALGASLRGLRSEAGLRAADLAERLGWAPSKVSKLENGRQTATAPDLRAWADAVGAPAAADGLLAQLRTLDTGHRSVQRHLAAGYAPVQAAALRRHTEASLVRGWETTVMPGILQTADYARSVFSANSTLLPGRRDVEEAVRGRMHRQTVLYDGTRRYRVLVWEPVLYELICDQDVLAAQLDRLTGLLGLDTLRLGIVPLRARMPMTARHGFWIFDDSRVTLEVLHASVQVEDAEAIGLYEAAWSRLEAVAAYRADAHQLISRARSAL
ncbi:helix-turn-helix transcriptional regulator [Kitasatospora cineracea]|uniref:helix-turn-helix domain-containing protein n=1 Tax=Kitasatospora cineracea TaxID=88074 RepID=UPI003438C91A